MPSTCRSLAQSGRLAALGLGLASCATQRMGGPDLDGPVFGAAHPTTFVAAPMDGTLHARDLATVARVLRRYKTLEAAERALIKSAVARRLNALVALEVQRLTLERHAEGETIRALPDRELAARRRAEFEAALLREANERVLRRLGRLLAVPLKTSDNRSPVAFARLSENGIEIGKDAAEVDQPLERLVEGNGVRTGAGESATIIATAAVAIQAAR